MEDTEREGDWGWVWQCVFLHVRGACACVCSCVYACPSLPGREREGDCAQNVAVRKSAFPHACVEARAHVRINRFASLQPCVCVHACATPPPPHLASVASSSSIQISGLWRRCRPDSRCTAPASYRGSSAAGEQSVGGRVALLLVASAGSNRWRLPLPWLSRYKNSLVSVLVSSLFSCVHRRGRSADETRHKPPVSALPAITAPYFSHNAVKSKKNKKKYIKKIINHTLLHIFCCRYSSGHRFETHSGLPVRHVSPVCLSVREQQLSLNGSSKQSFHTPLVSLCSHGQRARPPIKKNIWKTQQCLRKQLRPLLWKAPVCIPLTEARGARAAGASPSSCVQLTRVTRSITGKRAVCLSQWKPHSPLCGSKRVVRINEPLDGKENKNI